MASFDKYSNYNKDAGVSGVVFGANAPVLEVELNEMQEIQKNLLGNTLKNLIGDGISNKKAITYSEGVLSIADNCFLTVGGYLIQCTGLTFPITSGTIYLQVWEEVIDSNSTLKKAGNEQSTDIVENYIKDSRVPVETTRRKVVKYKLSDTLDSTKQNLAIASIDNGVATILVKEVNLTNLSDEMFDLQTYFENRFKSLEEKSSVTVSNNAPSDINGLWIDTTNTDGAVSKYYDKESESWVTVKATWG